MKVNIQDIAKMAGVSVSTVSKILNNYTDISEDTRKRVLAIIEETGYKSISNRVMTSKASQRSNLIGVIFAGKLNIDITHPFFVGVINSFKKQMGVLGYDLIFFSNEKFHPAGEDYLIRCQHFNVDGCIIIQGEELEPSIAALDQSSIPCIGVDLRLTGKFSGYIMSDNMKISQKVAEHFYLLGYKEVGFIGSTEYSEISNLRERSLIETLERFGMPVNPDWFVHGDTFFEESSYKAMKQMIKKGSLPRAIFAASDLLAIGAIRALKEHGLRVPEDVAIIGCDDIEASRYTTPTLSTVRQDKDKIGRLAAMMLYDIINHQVTSSSVVVEPDLVIRNSG